MDESYDREQRLRIMLEGDLLGIPLTSGESAAVRDALARSDGDERAALASLPPALAERAQALMQQGIRLSLELSKLGQRGVRVVFADEDAPWPVAARFEQAPGLLFAIGRTDLLDDPQAQVAVTRPAFVAADCVGVLIADAPFDDVLGDPCVASAIGGGRALVVSDAFRSRAGVVPPPDGDTAPKPDPVGVSMRSNRRVFVSGSRSQQEIPRIVQDSLDAITRQGFAILIGDSDKGVDNEIIDFLRVPLYPHVTIYTISERPRVRPEAAWEVRTIPADASLKPRERQMTKDRAMADAANWGLAVLDPIELNRYGSLQVSAGTLRNVIQMLMDGKMVKLFYRYGAQMCSSNLRSLGDLEAVIASYQGEPLTEAQAKMILSARGVAPGADAADVKRGKIEAKYRALLKAEQRLRGDARKKLADSAQTSLPLGV